MGHIELAAAVTHIWYFKGVPSRLGYLLDLAPKDLEKVIYFAAYMITSVDEDSRHRDLPSLQNKIDVEDRKSTRLNSSHVANSYADFCLKKKKSYNNKQSYTILYTS